MCRCRPEARTPCCGRDACHGTAGKATCQWCGPLRSEKPSKPRNPTFYDTVTHSPQWKAWEAEQERRAAWWNKAGETRGIGPLLYDMAEVMECGWISQEHFQAFLAFTIEETRRK